MSSTDGFRALTAQEISDNYERILDLARRGSVFVRDDVDASLPDCLMTPQAMELWKKLKKAGWIDDDYNTIGLSYAKKSVLASMMATRLGIRNVWKVFGECWKCNPETLRSAYNKALGQKQYGEYYLTINTTLYK